MLFSVFWSPSRITSLYSTGSKQRTRVACPIHFLFLFEETIVLMVWCNRKQWWMWYPNTNLLIISISRVAGDCEVLQQVNTVIFIISTQASFQESVPVIVIPVRAGKGSVRGILSLAARQGSQTDCEFAHTKLSLGDRSRHHKLPESAWTDPLPPLHCQGFYLKSWKERECRR